MNNKYYDLYYTVTKNTDEKESLNIEYENKDFDYISFDGFIILNQYIGRKKHKMILMNSKMRSGINHFNKWILYK